jgi:hypothetical protein
MSAHVRIVLKKSFLGDERKFLEPLMRFARGDIRDHIVSHKNDHGASYRRYGVLPWRRRPKITFCEIFGVVRFSTFATLSRAKRTSHLRTQTSELDPKRTWEAREDRAAASMSAALSTAP